MSSRKDGAVHPFLPVRQLRGQLDCFSAEAKKEMFGLRCPPEEDTARQEFKAEADTKTILTRFGAGAVFPHQGSGVIDYGMEFRTIADATMEARLAFERIPVKYRRGYATWRELLEGVARGEVDLPPAPVAAGGSGAAGGGAPSDSAAGGVPKVAPPP